MIAPKKAVFFLAVFALILIWISSVYSIHSNLEIAEAKRVQQGDTGVNLTFSFKNNGFYPLYVSARISVYSSDSGENLGNFIVIFGMIKARSTRNQSIVLDIEPVQEMEVVIKAYYEAKLFFLPGIRVPLSKTFHISVGS